jgi:hypothetical protein
MLTLEHRPSGLVAARDALDEKTVGAALRRLHPRLVLQKHCRDVPGGWMYKVVWIVSDDRPPIIVYTHMDERGRPLPLSSALVDAVQERMVGARNQAEPADAWNERMVAETRGRLAAESAELRRDHEPYVERGRVGVSMATMKKRPYWQRRGTPRSGVDR